MMSSLAFDNARKLKAGALQTMFLLYLCLVLSSVGTALAENHRDGASQSISIESIKKKISIDEEKRNGLRVEIEEFLQSKPAQERRCLVLEHVNQTPFCVPYYSSWVFIPSATNRSAVATEGRTHPSGPIHLPIDQWVEMQGLVEDLIGSTNVSLLGDIKSDIITVSYYDGNGWRERFALDPWKMSIALVDKEDVSKETWRSWYQAMRFIFLLKVVEPYMPDKKSSLRWHYVYSRIAKEGGSDYVAELMHLGWQKKKQLEEAEKEQDAMENFVPSLDEVDARLEQDDRLSAPRGK